jgi:hypothetical protein
MNPLETEARACAAAFPIPLPFDLSSIFQSLITSMLGCLMNITPQKPKEVLTEKYANATPEQQAEFVKDQRHHALRAVRSKRDSRRHLRSLPASERAAFLDSFTTTAFDHCLFADDDRVAACFSAAADLDAADEIDEADDK